MIPLWINVTFILDISHLIFHEVKAVHDELSTQEPLNQRYVEDDVEKVESVAQHQLVGPEVVAPVEILEQPAVIKRILSLVGYTC